MKTSSIWAEKTKSILKSAGVAVFWLAVWQLAYFAAGQEILVASPANVARRLFELIREAEFWQTVGMSVLRIMSGYVTAVFVGAVLAFLTESSKLLNALLHPLIRAARATPVASFIILALVWIANGKVPAFIAALVAAPLIWENVREGIARTDKNLLETAKLFRVSRGRVITKIYIPSVFPYFVSGAVSALGLAWKSGIAAEVLSVPKSSIGLELYDSKIYLETVDLFAWTLTVIVLSIILERLIVFLLGKIDRSRSGRGCK